MIFLQNSFDQILLNINLRKDRWINYKNLCKIGELGTIEYLQITTKNLRLVFCK